MLSSPALAAILRHLADEVEKVDVPPAPPPAPDPPPEPAKSPPLPQTPQPPDPAPAPPPHTHAAAPPALAAGPKPMIDLTTIKGIQQAFNQIRGANFPKLEENGLHDAVMTWALKEFQASVGIPVTGAIDEATTNTLHKAIFGTPRT